MLIENIKYFYANCDFDLLMNWLERADPVEVLLNPFVLGPLLIVIGLTAYSRTSELGQKLIIYIPTTGYLFVTFVILKNDNISSPGPFILAITSFFIIFGWLIWTRLLKS